MRELKFQKTKTLKCKDNGRSADATSANFILGCKGEKCSYCYVSRWDRPKIYVNTNMNDILDHIDLWIESKPWSKTPNQVHNSLYGIDISCNTDLGMHWKDYDWFKVFDWFKEHPKAFATFATKYANYNLLNYEANGKIRVRLSMMPEKVRQEVEKGTSPIDKRIKILDKLVNKGYSSHINFSPVIYYNGWQEDYIELFEQISKGTSNKFKDQCGSEIIFLTHNESLHNRNLTKGLSAQEELMWQPNIQDPKVSQYGGNNVRYSYELKKALVEEFKEIHEKYFSSSTIRYIF